MMKEAYVLISTERGAEEETLEALKEFQEVVEAYMVYGVYDIIAKVEAEDSQELKGIIIREIREDRKIRSTITMMLAQQ